MSLPVSLNEITVIKMNRVQKAKGKVLLQFIEIFSVFLRGQALSIKCGGMTCLTQSEQLNP